ncbi:MAG: endonuclease domain-containing protein [Candidatus Paceibacterota bacterium]|jgi:very-short-patch-repair endonuclease
MFKSKKHISYDKKLTEKARQNRKNPTFAEKKLWYKVLCNKQFEKYKFLRQKPLLNYIVDFYCAKLLLAIEIDGDSHAEQEDYDKTRTQKLSEYGIAVIRFTNKEIIENIDGVYMDLKNKVYKRDAVRNANPS